MEGGENVLEAIYEDETLEDVDMLDAESLEEGECEEQKECIEFSEGSGKHTVAENQESNNESQLCGPKRKRKEKKKKKKMGYNSDVKDLKQICDPAKEVLKDALQDLTAICQHVRSTFDNAVVDFRMSQPVKAMNIKVE
ncbi:hypothetical protein GIB67_007643 [Kingdonia uniflora]|uniref:Uncharacterized protein n=1 Tax=Kingdonia uniflora TaxID=39325 RepID=A0A7J7N1V7_9MAGN|nr:hypothetical protein GIB67_007643 [Kingdonia uniflora]